MRFVGLQPFRLKMYRGEEMIVLSIADIVNVIWGVCLLVMTTYFIYSFTVERKRKKNLIDLEKMMKEENYKIKKEKLYDHYDHKKSSFK